jgi:hypothetical protein
MLKVVEERTDVWRHLDAMGRHIRLSQGVVGKCAAVAVVLICFFVVLAFRLPPEGLVTLFIGGTLTVAFILGGMLWFAHRHPETALLEGAELLAYRAQEIAAKGFTPPPDAQVMMTPQSYLGSRKSEGDIE